MLKVSRRIARPRCVFEDGTEAFHVKASDAQSLVEGSVRVWSPGREWVELAAGRVWARRTAADTFWLVHYGMWFDGGRWRLQVAEREVRRHELVPAVARSVLTRDRDATARVDVPRRHPVRAYRDDLQELHANALLALAYAGMGVVGRSSVWVEHCGGRPGTFEWHAACRIACGGAVPPLPPLVATQRGQIVEPVRCSGCEGTLLPGVQRLAWQRLGIDPEGDEPWEPPF